MSGFRMALRSNGERFRERAVVRPLSHREWPRSGWFGNVSTSGSAEMGPKSGPHRSLLPIGEVFRGRLTITGECFQGPGRLFCIRRGR